MPNTNRTPVEWANLCRRLTELELRSAYHALGEQVEVLAPSGPLADGTQVLAWFPVFTGAYATLAGHGSIESYIGRVEEAWYAYAIRRAEGLNASQIDVPAWLDFDAWDRDLREALDRA